MNKQSMDDFSDADRWMPVASGEAVLKLTTEAGPTGRALRLDFDFKGGGGFVVARREFAMPLPETYAFSFRIRGEAPPNKLEFKLVDPSGKNVWRWQQDAFDFSPSGRDLHLRSRQMEFAWGPAGGGSLHQLGAVEFVISAGPGGKGTVWIEDFCYEDRTCQTPPTASASSTAEGRAAEFVLAAVEPGMWKSAEGDTRPWLQLDFHEPREYGGLIVTWAAPADPRAYCVEASDDGKSWRSLHAATDDRRARSFISLPGGESRFLRFVFDGPAGIRSLEVQPFDFSRSLTDFFHAMAQRSPRGRFPRWLSREQSYWTCAGVPDGHTCALINEEGMVEPDKGSFSVEPILVADGCCFFWADGENSVHLEPEGLPIPSVLWKRGPMRLLTTCFATGRGRDAVLFIRYRLTNQADKTVSAALFAAIRPFQVNPPWQGWQGLGGVREIRDLAWKAGVAWVNQNKPVIPLSPPAAFGAASFEHGNIADFLAEGTFPDRTSVQDDFGYASGAMRFEVEMPPGGQHEIFLAVPFGGSHSPDDVRMIAKRSGAGEFAAAVQAMQERVGAVSFDMPDGVARAAVQTFRVAAGQILINRDGPAIQPGPRRYTRSWIRDGVIMGAALLRCGERRALPEFVRWYAPHQREDGFVPCCVDHSGPDWLVEHDSHGQLIYGIMEAFRFTGDRAFLQEMWPHVEMAARFMAQLRAERMTPEYQTVEKRDRWGLLPESASHEGYLAHPVHSYWDDFWALRGFRDAAAMAAELGRENDSAEFAALADAFRISLRDSLRRVITEKNLSYVPGSVEWADFDPTATANAVTLLQGMADLPAGPLGEMFSHFVHDFRRKHRGEMDWNNYTAYEIRIIGALVHLGRRAEALELLTFFLSDRRPLAWNQWPEISWKNPRSPGHLGDLPHTWIAAEYMLVFAQLFAYEREEDGTLIIGAGIDDAWLSGSGVAVQSLPTWYGKLDLAMRRTGEGSIEVEIAGQLRLPPGGFVVRPPGERAIAGLVVNGHAVGTFSDREALIATVPARAVIVFSPDPAQALLQPSFT